MIKKKKFQSKTYKMWLRASKIIPEGNLMISKNPTLFNEKKWPSHFIRSKGCFIWDLDNKKYTDCSLMGVGTNILGYCNLLCLSIKSEFHFVFGLMGRLCSF